MRPSRGFAYQSELDQNAPKSQFSSLATRSTVLYSVLVGGAVLLAGWLIGGSQRDLALAIRESDLEHRADTVGVRIETEIRAVANDVRFLAESPFLRRIADTGDPQNAPDGVIAEAEETLAALLAGKPSYAQSRLLHLSGPGNELLRIDQRAGDVLAVPRGDLQPKGHRDYFKASAQLAKGEIYLSPINLNREFGEISTPHTPTLRAAAKVSDNAGTPFGLVVINVDLRSLFAELVATAGVDASLYIANGDGDYLVHPDPSKTFGFDLGKRFRLSDTLGPDPVDAPQSDDEIIRFVRLALPRGAGRELVIGVGTPRDAVLSELTAIRNRSLTTALAAALLAATLVWGLASKVDRQVEALEHARRVADENRRAKEEFLATLSHEIRTPMNAVTGLVHALAADRPAPHQAAKLGSLQFASRKLIAVVNDVLDFSKIEAGKLTFHSAPFDLYELLDNIKAGNAPQAKQGEVKFAIDRHGDVPQHLVGDSLRLYQTLNNLVQNALKFTKPGGEVTVAVLPSGGRNPDRVRLSFHVKDNGIGMDAAGLENALSRFGQAKGEHRFGGTGLGLPISKMLVEMQGGRFEAQSAPGEGSEFRFELEFDRLPDGSAAPSATVGAPHDLRGTRILCVEDVASNRLVVSALLEPTGTELGFAEDAAGTLAILETAEEPPDLILLDLQLPDRDGASLAADLRQRWPEIPIVGLTAQTAGELLERCKRAGVTTFLWKPIDPEQFFETVTGVFDPSLDAGPEPSRSPIDPSPVDAMFDGDAAKAGRYLMTLAAELDDASEALPALAAEQDPEGVRRLHHRLQNGLNLIGAEPSLDRLAALAETIDSEQQLETCLQSLGETAAELRSCAAARAR